ncbi:MAG: hypothetical protein ABJE47_05950 [bacterium]
MTVPRERSIPTIFVITLLAAICRLAALGQPMRFDEAVSWAYYVGRPWATIVGTYQQPNNHVLYSLLAKLCAEGVNYAPWALRLPALVAGIAVVPLTWQVGRRFADDTSALFAAALSVGATQLVLYSTNARGYTIVVAVFLALLLIADDLRTHATVWRWVAFAVLAAAGLYAIPVMLYPLGVVCLWLLLASRLTAPAQRTPFQVSLVAAVVASALIAGILYLPIIQSAGLRALTGNKFVAPSSWAQFVDELPRMVGSTLASWTSPLPLWCIPVMAVLALLGIRRPTNSGRPSLALAVALWCGALLVATHRAPFVRIWLFLLPLFFIATARGALRVARRFTTREIPHVSLVAIGLGVASLAVAVFTHAAEQSDDTGAFRPAEQVTALLAPRLHRGDRVLAPIPAIGPLLYYFPRAGADTTLLTVSLDVSNRAFLVLDAHQGQTLAWAIANHIIDPAVFAEPTLLAKYPDGELWETSRR